MSSDASTQDVLSGFASDIPSDSLREAAATIVKGSGSSLEAVNAALAARGVAPLNTGSKDYAENRKDALTRDSNFMAKYSAGDPEAIAKLYAADVAVINGKGNLLDRAPSADDDRYGQLRNVVYANSPAETAIETADRVAAIASSLHMDGENAKTMIELQYQADRTLAPMTAEQRETWGDWQLQSLKSALGPDAEAKLTKASEVISRLRGQKTDIAATVRESGASIGFQLVSAAQNAAYRNEW